MAGTFNKGYVKGLVQGKKIVSIIAVGHGKNQGVPHKSGPMSGIDKGIIKHHFELGAGKENFEWA